jgi:ribosome-associated protein
MDGDLFVRHGFVIPAHELHWRFSRASGPGGQGVNTTDSRVQLTYDLATSASVPDHLRQRALRRLAPRLQEGRLTVVAAESRSQWQNRHHAQQRLADLLREATAAPARTRRPTRPTKASVERRIKDKKARATTKRLRQSRDADI